MDTGRKDANIQIGKRLREARLNMNLEKSEIADVLGVTVEHYRKLEAGITGISVDKVLTLYHKYGIDPTYLITGESSMKDFNLDYYVANFVFDMQLSVGSVFAFITYSAYVTGPISAILNIGYLLSGIIPSTKRYYEFMALEEEKENEEGMTEPCFGDLELQNLSFSYEKDKAVLSDINIAFPKGSKTVLIGRNGSGKSTLISLLLQLYQPTGGKITLNGIDISEFVLREYRNMISVVSQEIYLFNSSIRDNICMYKNIDDKTIMEACKDSGLADFISEVSLDYVVGQNGAMLSEGQKQKIALARALVHNSPVIIFDEATSNTDVYSEHQINGLLHTKLKEKTVIIITHKQEILKEADQIIMLKDGAVVGSGVYDDLSKDNLEFKNMLNMGEKY